MTYEKLEQLEGKTLGLNDIVSFALPEKKKKLVYTVEHNYLSNGSSNGIIFDELGLNKNEFCDRLYGFKNGGGDWPQTQSYGDKDALEAMTRVVVGLYCEIEKLKILTLLSKSAA